MKQGLLLGVGIVVLSGVFVLSSAVGKPDDNGNATVLQIEAKLPGGGTLATASKEDVLVATAKSISEAKQAAPQIVASVLRVRHDFARDVVGVAMDALGTANCDAVAAVASAAIGADPDDAAAIVESTAGRAPNCSNTIERTAQLSGPTNSTKVASTVASASVKAASAPMVARAAQPEQGGGQRGKCPVCHNGHIVYLPCRQVSKFLRHHPGDTAGACNVTPTTNR